MANNLYEDDHHHDALLVRDEMERALAQLPPVEDLVGPAVAQGRRRRARARLALVAGVACLAGAVALGTAALPTAHPGGTKDGPATAASPEPRSAEPTPGSYRTPVHTDPTGRPAASTPPPAERQRREEYQQRAAVLLDDLLPDEVGLLRPSADDVRRYQGEAKGGARFPVFLSVRPADGASNPRTCPGPSPDARGVTCAQAPLPGGITATSLRYPSDGPGTTATTVSFAYGASEVSLTVTPDTSAAVSAPVSGEQLLRAVADPRFLDLVRYAVDHPVQEAGTSIPGG
ncbi:hypothetical protein [Streptomyces sp. NPDC048606]|uniref:hypothetical protein n=1 Tax=Streptomyces sp. NPDC048606 TaxID=3154726 RepID=UPI00342FEA54